MKKIERPNSTSFEIGMTFHLCKDENEFNNSIKNVEESNIVKYGKIIDPESYMPYVLYFVRDSILNTYLNYAVYGFTFQEYEESKKDSAIENFNKLVENMY